MAQRIIDTAYNCSRIFTNWFARYCDSGGVWLLGWARPRAREGRLATTLIILTALMFQVLWFVFLGLKLGFLQNVYVWNWQSVLNVFLPVALMIVFEEILRGQMVARGHESRLAIVLAVITCVVLEVIWVLPIYNLMLPKDGLIC